MIINQKTRIKKTYEQKETVEEFDKGRSKFKFQRYKHQKESKILLKAIKQTNKKQIKILDIPCGTGRLLPPIFSSKKKIAYYGVDTSNEMIKNIRIKKIFKKNKKNIFLKKGDALNIPFKDSTFDITFTYHLTWHLPFHQQKKIIKELLRVTKKGGIVIFDILNKDFIWEKIKNFLGIEKTEGIYKASIKNIKKLVKIERIKEINKLNDFPIKSDLIYGIFNNINKIERILPSSLYHMIFFTIKK